MSFNTVGIQDNLPVQPIHVLQIIQSLTFSGAYSAENFFRQGRTNFGAAAFTSSAHVEMHSYGGVDPLVVYSGPYNDTEVFSIDLGGTTTATQLTASDATITTLAVANEAVDNSSITTALIDNATIQTALVGNLTATNGVITTLNSTVGAITTFTASNARVTGLATVGNITVNNTANIDTANITDAVITTGQVDDLTSTTATVDDLTAATASVSQNLTVGNDATITNDLTVSNDVSVANNLSVGGTATSQQTEISFANTDYINANGDNSHLLLNNSSATGQTVISSVINGTLRGKIRSDFAGNLQYISSGSGTGGNHYFYTEGDYPGGTVKLTISSSGNVGIGTTTPTAKLQVVGTAKATQFEGPLEGTASWAINVVNGGVAGNPAGSDGEVQYNNSGLFGAIPQLVYVGGALSATGSFKGDLNGTASFANLVQGPGITINGMAITASVQTVNGINPINGNVAVSLAGVQTGLSSSNYDINLVASSSGAITASFSNGALWVVSAETGSTTSGSNGEVYIFKSGSVGQWLRVAPLDTAAADARYLRLAGGTMGGNVNMSTYNLANAGTVHATNLSGSVISLKATGGAGNVAADNITTNKNILLPDQSGTLAIAITSSLGQTQADSEGNINIETVPTASFVTGSNVYGPHGANSVVSASYAISASYAPNSLDTTNFITTGSISARQGITGSLIITGSAVITGSIVIANNTDTTRPFRLGAAVANIGNIYPIPSVVPYDLTRNWNNLISNGPGFDYNQAQFPSFNPYYSNGGNSSGGNNTFYYTVGHLGIGNYGYDPGSGITKLEAIYLRTVQATSPDAASFTAATSVVTTVVSDNNTLNTTDNITSLATANGRAHILVVTGSMLARDGVTLGTNIANSHNITGSVNMTGSFTLNGTNLATLTSPVQSVKVTVSSAQLLNLSLFSPLTLVPAQGSGKVIRPLSIAMVYNYGTTNYVGGSLVANYAGGGSYMLTSNILTSYSTNKIQYYNPGGGSQVWDLSAASNQALILAAQSAITNGDGTLTVYVDYTVLSL